MEQFYASFSAVMGLGVDPKELTFLQISLRGIFVFVVTLLIIRASQKRSLAKKTPFDAVLLVILASVLSRAINGSAAFFPTLGASLVIVLFHRLVSFAAYHSHTLGILIKGQPDVIFEDGKPNLETMRRNHVSEHDLAEDLRLEARIEDLSKIRIARVERSGDISFIKKEEA